MMTKHTACELLIDWAGNEKPFTTIYFSNPENAIETYNNLREMAKNKPYFVDDKKSEIDEAQEMGFAWSEDGDIFNCTCVNLYFNSIYYTADEPVSIDELMKE